MGTLGDNPFGGPATTWRSALLKATLVQGALLLLAWGAATSASGADNPLGFLIPLLLQLPASLVFVPALSGFGQFLPEWQALVATAVVISVLQLHVLVVLFKKPWS